MSANEQSISGFTMNNYTLRREPISIDSLNKRYSKTDEFLRETSVYASSSSQGESIALVSFAFDLTDMNDIEDMSHLIGHCNRYPYAWIKYHMLDRKAPTSTSLDIKGFYMYAILEYEIESSSVAQGVAYVSLKLQLINWRTFAKSLTFIGYTQYDNDGTGQQLKAGIERFSAPKQNDKHMYTWVPVDTPAQSNLMQDFFSKAVEQSLKTGATLYSPQSSTGYKLRIGAPRLHLTVDDIGKSNLVGDVKTFRLSKMHPETEGDQAISQRTRTNAYQVKDAHVKSEYEKDNDAILQQYYIAWHGIELGENVAIQNVKVRRANRFAVSYIAEWQHPYAQYLGRSPAEVEVTMVTDTQGPLDGFNTSSMIQATSDMAATTRALYPFVYGYDVLRMDFPFSKFLNIDTMILDGERISASSDDNNLHVHVYSFLESDTAAIVERSRYGLANKNGLFSEMEMQKILENVWNTFKTSPQFKKIADAIKAVDDPKSGQANTKWDDWVKPGQKDMLLNLLNGSMRDALRRNQTKASKESYARATDIMNKYAPKSGPNIDPKLTGQAGVDNAKKFYAAYIDSPQGTERFFSGWKYQQVIAFHQALQNEIARENNSGSKSIDSFFTMTPRISGLDINARTKIDAFRDLMKDQDMKFIIEAFLPYGKKVLNVKKKDFISRGVNAIAKEFDQAKEAHETSLTEYESSAEIGLPGQGFIAGVEKSLQITRGAISSLDQNSLSPSQNRVDGESVSAYLAAVTEAFNKIIATGVESNKYSEQYYKLWRERLEKGIQEGTYSVNLDGEAIPDLGIKEFAEKYVSNSIDFLGATKWQDLSPMFFLKEDPIVTAEGALVAFDSMSKITIEQFKGMDDAILKVQDLQPIDGKESEGSYGSEVVRGEYWDGTLNGEFNVTSGLASARSGPTDKTVLGVIANDFKKPKVASPSASLDEKFKTIGTLLAKYCDAFGVPRELALQMSYAESKWQTSVVNGAGASATGLFQFTNGTWAGLKRKQYTDMLAQYGLGDWSKASKEQWASIRTNPQYLEHQIAIGTMYLKTDEYNVVVSMGLPPKPVYLYMIHFLGGGAGPTVLSAIKRGATNLLTHDIAGGGKVYTVTDKKGNKVQKTMTEMNGIYMYANGKAPELATVAQTVAQMERAMGGVPQKYLDAIKSIDSKGVAKYDPSKIDAIKGKQQERLAKSENLSAKEKQAAANAVEQQKGSAIGYDRNILTASYKLTPGPWDQQAQGVLRMLDMAKAFERGMNTLIPTCKVYAIHGNDANSIQHILNFGAQTAYYELFSIRNLRVETANDNNPVAAAYFEMANPINTTMDPVLNIESGGMPRSKTDIKGLGSRYTDEITKDQIRVKPGTKIQIRMGYGNDINKLDIVFNGVISETSGGEIIEVIAEGYGRELQNVVHAVGDMAPKLHAFSGDAERFYSSMLEKVMEMGDTQHFGKNPRLFSSSRDISARYLSARDPNGQFSLSNSFFNLSTGEFFWRDLTRSSAIYENIYLPEIEMVDKTFRKGWLRYLDLLPASGDAFFKDFNVFGDTTWDVLKNVVYQYPGTVARVKFIDARATTFVGIKEQLMIGKVLPPEVYDFANRNAKVIESSKSNTLIDAANAAKDVAEKGWEIVQQLNPGTTAAKEIVSIYRSVTGGEEKVAAKKEEDKSKSTIQGLKDDLLKDTWVPSTGFHMLSTAFNVISNNLRLSTDFNTVVKVGYSSNVEKFKTEEVDLFDLKVNGNLAPMDFREEVVYNTSVATKKSAMRHAQSYLMNELEQMYSGEIVIIGDAKINAGDYCYISDSIRQMTGIIKCREVTHMFTHDDGFITVIVPGLYVEPGTHMYSVLFPKLGLAACSIATAYDFIKTAIISQSSATEIFDIISNFGELRDRINSDAKGLAVLNGAAVVGSAGITWMSLASLFPKARLAYSAFSATQFAVRATTQVASVVADLAISTSRMASAGASAISRFTPNIVVRVLSPLGNFARLGGGIASRIAPRLIGSAVGMGAIYAGAVAAVGGIAYNFYDMQVKTNALRHKAITRFPLKANGREYSAGVIGWNDDKAIWDNAWNNAATTWRDTKQVAAAIEDSKFGTSTFMEGLIRILK